MNVPQEAINAERFYLYISGIEVGIEDAQDLREAWNVGAAAERDRITACTQTLKEEAGRLALLCGDPLLAVGFSAQQEALAAVLDLIGDGT